MASADFLKSVATIQKKCANAIKPADSNTLKKMLRLDSPRLSYMYGGGIKIGAVHRYIGPESGGKSTICTYIAGQFQKHLGEQFPELADHDMVVYMDFERSFDPDHARENGLDTTSLVNPDGSINKNAHFTLLQPDNLEEGAFALEQMIKSNSVACVIFDSESMSVTKTVMEDEFNKANFGSGAKALKDFCNRFNILCANYHTTMFIISQERAQMNTMSHAIQTTGGYALKYVASTLNRVRKIENLTEGSKIIGIHMQVRNMKNKTAIPFRECEMDLYYQGGFNSDGEYVDFLKDFNEDQRLVKYCYAGNGGVFKSEEYGWSFRGKDNFVQAIKDGDVVKKEHWDHIKEIIMEIISNEIEGMENTADPEQEAEQNFTKEDYEKAVAAAEEDESVDPVEE